MKTLFEFKVLPLEDRLNTYQKALDVIKSNDRLRGMLGNGLCIMLPMIHWKLKLITSYIDNCTWSYRDTIIAFPELKRHLTRIDNCKTDVETDEVRQVCLKLMIASVKARMKTQQRKCK